MQATGLGSKLLCALAVVFVLCTATASRAEEQGFLGVMLQPLTPEIKEAMDIDKNLEGALVSEVIDGSPAEKAGLEDGDIIVRIGNKATGDLEATVGAIKAGAPGEELKVTVLRDGQEKTLMVVLGQRPEPVAEPPKPCHSEMKKPGPAVHKCKRAEQGYLGVRIEKISSDLGRYFGVDKGDGVLVLEVIDDSPADDAGIKAGDVIVKFGGKKVTCPKKLTRYVSKAEPDEDVEIVLKRRRSTKRLTVEIASAAGSCCGGRMGMPCGGSCMAHGMKCSPSGGTCSQICGRCHGMEGPQGMMHGPCSGMPGSCACMHHACCGMQGMAGPMEKSCSHKMVPEKEHKMQGEPQSKSCVIQPSGMGCHGKQIVKDVKVMEGDLKAACCDMEKDMAKLKKEIEELRTELELLKR